MSVFDTDSDCKGGKLVLRTSFEENKSRMIPSCFVRSFQFFLHKHCRPNRFKKLEIIFAFIPKLFLIATGKGREALDHYSHQFFLTFPLRGLTQCFKCFRRFRVYGNVVRLKERFKCFHELPVLRSLIIGIGD